MEIKINKQILDNALEYVSKAVDTNPFIPAMKGILIEAEDDLITFIGSDGEISIKHTVKTSINAQIINPGICLVELNILKNVEKKLDGDISLITNDKLLTVIAGSDKYTLNLYDNTEYPSIDFSIYGEKLTIEWAKFKDIAKDVWFAAATDDKSVILGCVNISASNKQLKMLATDRYRYAQETLPIESDIEFNISVQQKNLKNILAFEHNGPITLHISDFKIAFEFDNNIIQSKIVEQIYMDVSKIMPKEFANTLIIEKRELNNLLNKASVIITESYNKIRLHIINKVLTISSSREEIAAAEIKTSNFEFSNDELKLALNSKFLRDAISVFDDKLKIQITKDNLKLVVTSASNPNNIQLFTGQKGF